MRTAASTKTPISGPSVHINGSVPLYLEPRETTSNSAPFFRLCHKCDAGPAHWAQRPQHTPSCFPFCVLRIGFLSVEEFRHVPSPLLSACWISMYLALNWQFPCQFWAPNFRLQIGKKLPHGTGTFDRYCCSTITRTSASSVSSVQCAPCVRTEEKMPLKLEILFCGFFIILGWIVEFHPNQIAHMRWCSALIFSWSIVFAWISPSSQGQALLGKDRELIQWFHLILKLEVVLKW